MLIHPQFDPVAFSLGPLAVRWYGLMYLVAFAQFYVLGRWRIAQRQPGQPLYGFSARDVEDLLFYGVVGVVLGGRFGHVLFYSGSYYLQNPLKIFAVWEGGMAFHGGLIGVLVACAVFARRKGVRFLALMDFVAPLVPLGLAAGRFANFINGELWGRVTDVPWGMVFPQSGSELPRHPSQLYQMAGEGLLLFALLWWYSSKPRATGAVSGMFLIGYGICRFLAEFVREPDAHLGTILGPFTMGQLLTLPMLLAGVWLVMRARAGRGMPSGG
ncbi:MAG: prolipoprotein diacylglyceryl transferase [Lautropia sp.]|nr:prolipoprotein diacylglyceryl transferase [Lautropia sp.]